MLRRAFLVAATGLLLTGCEEGTDFLGPEPEVLNVMDAFEFEISELEAETHTLSYAWLNTGTGARVIQEGSLFGGNATLEILDGGGRRVYLHELKSNGTFVTETGTTGSWTIRVLLAQAGGGFNFRVEKRP